MNREFLKQRLADVIRIDATTAEKADFLATHVPFENLEYVESGISEENSVSLDEEEFFRNNIMAERDKHNFIVVQGRNGSGKSHFIRWLKEKYENEIEPDEEEVLLISRSQSTLQGALEQILASDIFQEEEEIEELEKMNEASKSLNEQDLKQQLAFQFAHIADREENNQEDDINLSKRHKRSIFEFFVDRKIQEHLSKPGAPLDRIASRLVPDDSQERKDEIDPQFTAGDFEFNYVITKELRSNGASKKALRLAEDLARRQRSKELRKNLAKYLNQQLEEVIQTCAKLNSTDLQKVFKEVRRKLRKSDKNLTLFIEDITSFTGINRALMEALILEHRGEGDQHLCRLFSVVGITSGYYRDSLRDNIKDRITGRILLDKALLEANDNNEKLVEMAARYINAIHLQPEKLNNWLNRGARIEELPIAENHLKQEWALFQLPDGRKISLFPFNKRALRTMYRDISPQTPREFLRGIIRYILNIYFDAPDEFPPEPEELTKGQFGVPRWEPPTHKQIVEEQAGEDKGRLKSLLLWWGNASAFRQKDILGSLPSATFEIFDVTPIEGAEGEKRKSGEKGSTQKNTQTQAEGDALIGVSSGGSSTPDKKEGGTSPEPEPPDSGFSEGEKELRKIQDELDAWLNRGEKLGLYKKLRNDVIDVLLEYIDWEFEGVSTYLVNAKLDSNTVSIAGQLGTVRGEEVFKVKRNDASYYALLALTAWRHKGNRSWNFSNSTRHLLNLQNWIEGVKEEVIDSIKMPEDEKKENWNIYAWSTISQFYLQGVLGNLSVQDDSLIKIYIKLLKNEFAEQSEAEVLELGHNHSEKWNKFLSNKIVDFSSQFNHNYRIFTRYYNCTQGSVTNASSTKVYFLDVVEILEIIEELRVLNWDIGELNYPKSLAREAKKDNNVWYCSLGLMQLFAENINQLLEKETEYCTYISEKIEEFVGEEVNKENVEDLFTEMEGFLQKLQKIKEAYNAKKYQAIVANDGRFSAGDFIDLQANLKQAITASTTIEQLLRYSQETIGSIKNYLDLLNSMDQLVNRIKKKYTDKKDNFSKEVSDLGEIIKEIEETLIDTNERLKCLN